MKSVNRIVGCRKAVSLIRTSTFFCGVRKGKSGGQSGPSTRPRRVIPLLCASLAALLIVEEVRSSRLQSSLLAFADRKLTYGLADGPSDAIVYPRAGPYDRRLGYSLLPNFIPRLEAAGYQVQAQARDSTSFLLAARLGLYPPYREKSQAGIRILDPQVSSAGSADDSHSHCLANPERVTHSQREVPDIYLRRIS